MYFTLPLDELHILQSAGTDSTVKLWFTSISQTSEPTLEGSLFSRMFGFSYILNYF